MACLNPRLRRYYDAYSGEPRVSSYPCGKCASCLAALQESFSIRVMETAKSYTSFVYDTLTFRNSSVEWLDVSDAVSNGYVEPSPETLSIVQQYYPDWRVPVFPKSVFSRWLKQGRELYNYYHRAAIKEGRISRLHLKYLVCCEYGPKSSRCHGHLVMFGISPQDYLRFFAKPWRKNFGFTKTKYINQKVSNKQKDIECIARYVSKYVSKGDFESPLVKDGLQPKPWRQLSHGLGEEFLRRYAARYSELLTPESLEKKESLGVDYSIFYDKLDNQYKVRRVSGRGYVPRNCKPLDLTYEQAAYLTSYFDSAGYPHPLPRYYRDKLLGVEPNLLKYEVQNSLLAYAEQRRHKEVSQFAADSQCRQACLGRTSAEVERLLGRMSPLLAYLFVAKQDGARKRSNHGYKIKLRNFYNRPLNDPSNFH